MSSTNTETPVAPSVTINDKKYLISDLDEKSKVFLNDLTRTVIEYKELLRNYIQSLTLTNTYASGLKTEVEKIEKGCLSSDKRIQKFITQVDEISVKNEALSKELNDSKGKNGFFSVKDMVANFAGLFVAISIINY